MFTTLLVLALASPQSPARDLPFTGAGWETSDPKARVEMLGGKTALRLGNAMSIRRDVQLQDGTIEFDLWSTAERAFAFIHFRMQSDDESEAIYFRLHKTRLPDAIQYEPVYQRRGNWQLMHGPDATAAAELPAGRWIPVRLELRGEKAALFLDGGREPILSVPKLLRGTKGGYLALRASVGPNLPGDIEPPSSFANVRVKPDVTEYDFSKIVAPTAPSLPGLITKFRFSPAFSPEAGPVPAPPASVGARDSWPVVETLQSGLVVIGSAVKIPDGMRRYATVASFRVRAAEEGIKRLRIGFSDEVSVLLNGQIHFYGDQPYSFNFPRQEGLMHLDQASVYLPLKKGDNEVRLIVSDVFGGWGVMARFDDPAGLVIEP